MRTLYIVATPIGNLNDISFRAIEILKKVDMIACEDTRTTLHLLNNYEIKNKLISYHKFNEKKSTIDIINKIISDNIDVALVSDAGTPCISDPGYYLISEAHKNNINVISVPGPSAVITALSSSGFEIQEYKFLGFLSRNNNEQINQLKNSTNDSKIIVIYESPKRINNLLNNILLVDETAELSICRELTKIYETIYRGSIKELIKIGESDKNFNLGEFCVVIKWNLKYETIVNNEFQLIGMIFTDLYNGISENDIIKKYKELGYKRNLIYSEILKIKRYIDK